MRFHDNSSASYDITYYQMKKFGLCRPSPKVGSISFNFIPISKEYGHPLDICVFIFLHNLYNCKNYIW